jgi:3-isopropylmalate/(R)-2-methylmalate dehydratase large subunit
MVRRASGRNDEQGRRFVNKGGSPNKKALHATLLGTANARTPAIERLSFFEKVWREHVVADLGSGRSLVHIDRHMVHEGTSAEAFDALRATGRRVRNPELTFAVVDHVVSTMPGRTAKTFAPGLERIEKLTRNCADFGIPLFDISDPRQGIAHVVAPELGLALPGVTLVCGDSHTATCGGVGAYAWGIGTTEVEQVLASQCLILRRPRSMRVNFRGALGRGVYAKDLILHVIGTFGVDAGAGYAIEYSGAAIRSLPPEGRMTICNMSIEFGARSGFVGPDDTTFEYLSGRPFAPKGPNWDAALAYWNGLRSGDEAAFDAELDIDCAEIAPHVSWGTLPQDVVAVTGCIPTPTAAMPKERREGIESALSYMGLEPGTPIEGLPIDFAFVGSCTNGRLSDLIAAAEIIKGRKVAAGVKALAVPGSMQVKAAAESMGLDKVFTEAGFEWRNAGCSMCVAANEDVVAPEKRCISTSNRNFENRQGRGSRTHLASPAMVAAAAVTGRVVDVRKLMG